LPCSSTAIYQTSKLQLTLSTESTKRSTDYIDSSVFDQLEDNTFDIFAEDDNRDSNNTYPTKQQKLTTVFLCNPTSNRTIPKLYNNRYHHTQSLQPGLTAAGPQQLELKSTLLQELYRKGITRSNSYKYLISFIKLATTATTASAVLKSTGLEEPLSGSPVAELNQK
jgi:hypothetical protein